METWQSVAVTIAFSIVTGLSGWMWSLYKDGVSDVRDANTSIQELRIEVNSLKYSKANTKDIASINDILNRQVTLMEVLQEDRIKERSERRNDTKQLNQRLDGIDLRLVC